MFEAWKADALAPTAQGSPPTVVMIVGSNEQAAIVSERARHVLIDAGLVKDSPTVELRDNVASVGDQIVTRRNNRRLQTSAGGWVANGDVWIITSLRRDGSVMARRNNDGHRARLPADYLAKHAHLAYATTVYRAQGMTVDRCHAATSAMDTHAALYVAATRGRVANHVWVATDHPPVVNGQRLAPAAEHILETIVARKDARAAAAHDVLAQAQIDRPTDDPTVVQLAISGARSR